MPSPCPTCGRPVEWPSASGSEHSPQTSPWRPFCSERCKLIDLGAWASERHVIPGEVKVLEDDADNLKGE